MELEYKEEYIDLISHEVYSHTITTGVIVSIVLALASSIVLVVLFRISNLLYLFLYLLALVVLPMNVIAYVVAKRLSRNAKNETRIFVEAIEKIAQKLGSRKVELLETPPPPYIGIIKRGKYYVVISYYGFRGVVVSILDPLETRKIEGYVAIHLKKSRELITITDLDDKVKLRVYRLLAVLPEPLEDATVEGRFYSYEFRTLSFDPDKLSDYINKVFETISKMRRLEASGS